MEKKQNWLKNNKVLVKSLNVSVLVLGVFPLYSGSNETPKDYRRIKRTPTT